MRFWKKLLDKVKGVNWPKKSNGEHVRQAVVGHACKVIVHFPSGRQFKLASTSLFVCHEKSKVCNLSLCPLSGPQSFRNVVKEVERIIKELNVRESDRVDLPFKKWEEPKERFYNCVTMGRVEKGVKAHFEVKAVGNENGWMAVVELSIPKLYGFHQEEIERED